MGDTLGVRVWGERGAKSYQDPNMRWDELLPVSCFAQDASAQDNSGVWICRGFSAWKLCRWDAREPCAGGSSEHVTGEEKREYMLMMS